MPKPYPAALRERVLLAGEAGASAALVASQFRVGLSTVYLWRQRARTDNRGVAKPHAGGPIPQVDAAGHAVVRELVKDANHATLADYVERFARRTGQRISRARMRQLLKRLELPRKNRHFGRPSGIVPR